MKCDIGSFIFALFASTTSLARHKMVWSKSHVVLLCREILVTEPYRYKVGTRERGQAWDKVGNALNAVEGLRFVVDQRGVRERYAKVERNCKRKMAAEERASGITPEKTEVDDAIESIMERKEGAEEESACRAESSTMIMKRERETAESVRKRSMERLAETRERENQKSAKKKKSNGNGEEPMGFMKEKWRMEVELRKEELEIRKKEYQAKERKAEEDVEIRKRELDLKEREQQARERRDEKMLEILSHQQNQQQVILLQIQQGNQALLSMLNNLKEKIN